MWSVYRHKSPSGKVYIGITSKNNPELRWSNPLNSYKNNQYFCSAILKYGWNNFTHKILFTNINKISANLIEIDLIYYYKKLGICYNITDGGEGFLGLKHDQKWIDWLTHKNYGNQYSTGTHVNKKQKISISIKNKERERIWKENGYYKTFKIDNTPHAVIGTNINNSKDIIEFTTITDAAKAVNRTRANIRSAIKRKGTCAGYIWKFK